MSAIGEKKKIGLFSAICVCVGLIVASSCLLSLGQGVGLGGKWFILAICIVAVLNICVALSFAELHDLMPGIEGGLGQYTQVALGPVVSIVSNTSAYVFVALLAAPIEMAMCGMVLHELFLPGIPAALIGVVFALALGVINYFGVNIFSKVQNLVVGVLLLSLTALGFLSFFKLGIGQIVLQTAPPAAGVGFGTALALTALAFWLFIGVEYVVPVAKDVKNPKVTVPLAMALGIILLCVIQAVLGIGMGNYVTYADLVNSELPHMVFAENLLGKAGLLWMGIITFLASISTANTLMGAIPNILSGMAKNAMMPEIFEKKNKHNIPVAGLALVTAFLVFMVGSGFTQSAGLVNGLLTASCFWLVSYMLVSLSVLVLRRRYPNHPGRNNKLTLWGIPQFLCIVGNIYMIWNIAEGEARILIYKIFFVLFAALVVYALIWVGLVKKQPLFAGTDIEDVLINE